MHQDDKRPELRHRACQGAQEDPDRRRGKQAAAQRRRGTGAANRHVAPASTRSTITSNAKLTPIRDRQARWPQTLAIMISNGVSGITSRCSMVPCSRSRMKAPRQDDGQHGDVAGLHDAEPNQ